MKSTIKLILTALIITVFYGQISAGVMQDIDKAVSLYPISPTIAVDGLVAANRDSTRNYRIIVQRLTTLQQYNLLMDFYRALPVDMKTANNIFALVLKTGIYDNLVADYENHLKFTTVYKIAQFYNTIITEPTTSKYFESHITNYNVLKLLEASYILNKRFQQFDDILLHSKLNDSNSLKLVGYYVQENWRKKHRDIKALIQAYRLDNEPLFQGMIAYSEFMRGNYKTTINSYKDIESKIDTKLIGANKMDFPYIIGYSYFRLADYKKALAYFDKVHYPWDYDISRLTLLCYLGMDKPYLARSQLPMIKNGDAVAFYDALFDFITDNTNKAIAKTEEYIANLEAEHQYILEALLLAFTYYKSPKDLPIVVDVVKMSLLFQPPIIIKNISLSAALSEAKGSPADKTTSSYINDFIAYKKAIALIQAHESTSAKDILLDIIKSPKSSQLIRSLAIYQLRQIS